MSEFAGLRVLCILLYLAGILPLSLSVWTATYIRPRSSVYNFWMHWDIVGQNSTLPGDEGKQSTQKDQTQNLFRDLESQAEPHGYEVVRSSSCVAIAGIWLVVWNEWSSRLPGAVETFCPRGSSGKSIFGVQRYQNNLQRGAHRGGLGWRWRLRCDLEEGGWTFTFWVQVREALCGSGAQSVPRHPWWILPTCRCRLGWGWPIGLDCRSWGRSSKSFQDEVVESYSNIII